MPNAGTIGAIVSDPDPNSAGYDIVIRHRCDGPQRISYLHPMYMPLQYPLLFTYGESGWSPELRIAKTHDKKRDKKTMNKFYSYQIHDRLGVYSLCLRGGRLFQQYLVDAYICIEQNRLDYIRHNQSDLRSELLKGIQDVVQYGDTVACDIGKRTILPSSFTGGPRYMYKHYQDALAIRRIHGNPQYFVTFTCNVNWPEILRYMSQFPSLRAQDRPDVIARVFQLKVVSLINFLLTRKPFGKVVVYLYTIEFQKRGLPHCHLLLWVAEQYKVTSPKQLDKYISAEIPDIITEPVLHSIVTDCMIHGPCGLLDPNCSCMRSGTCSNKFPKPYQSSTSFDSNGYAHYKRRQSNHNVIKHGVSIDNTFVVPYNRALLLHFEAHINVEYCGWNMLITYLFKYISKGTDHVQYDVSYSLCSTGKCGSSNTGVIDEVRKFVDARFICPHEAS